MEEKHLTNMLVSTDGSFPLADQIRATASLDE